MLLIKAWRFFMILVESNFPVISSPSMNLLFLHSDFLVLSTLNSLLFSTSLAWTFTPLCISLGFICKHPLELRWNTIIFIKGFSIPLRGANGPLPLTLVSFLAIFTNLRAYYGYAVLHTLHTVCLLIHKTENSKTKNLEVVLLFPFHR